MCRIRVAAIEFKYKELDRQLKEQFIHGLNNSDMLAEIIRELTKTGEQVLFLAKRLRPREPRE